MSPMRSLFMYPGYLRVAVLVAMMVDTCHRESDGMCQHW